MEAMGSDSPPGWAGRTRPPRPRRRPHPVNAAFDAAARSGPVAMPTRTPAACRPRSRTPGPPPRAGDGPARRGPRRRRAPRPALRGGGDDRRHGAGPQRADQQAAADRRDGLRRLHVALPGSVHRRGRIVSIAGPSSRSPVSRPSRRSGAVEVDRLDDGERAAAQRLRDGLHGGKRSTADGPPPSGSAADQSRPTPAPPRRARAGNQAAAGELADRVQGDLGGRRAAHPPPPATQPTSPRCPTSSSSRIISPSPVMIVHGEQVVAGEPWFSLNQLSCCFTASAAPPGRRRRSDDPACFRGRCWAATSPRYRPPPPVLMRATFGDSVSILLDAVPLAEERVVVDVLRGRPRGRRPGNDYLEAPARRGARRRGRGPRRTCFRAATVVVLLDRRDVLDAAGGVLDGVTVF